MAVTTVKIPSKKCSHYNKIIPTYSISTLGGYLMTNPVYTYIHTYIHIEYDLLTNSFVDSIFKRAWDLFVSTELNDFKYFYVTLTIRFNISHLVAQLNSWI